MEWFHSCSGGPELLTKEDLIKGLRHLSDEDRKQVFEHVDEVLRRRQRDKIALTLQGFVESAIMTDHAQDAWRSRITLQSGTGSGYRKPLDECDDTDGGGGGRISSHYSGEHFDFDEWLDVEYSELLKVRVGDTIYTARVEVEFEVLDEPPVKEGGS